MSARRSGWQALAELYDLAVRVECSSCGAAAGSRCVNSLTQVAMRAPHPRRVREGEVAAFAPFEADDA